jgi:hypothetical protein
MLAQPSGAALALSLRHRARLCSVATSGGKIANCHEGAWDATGVGDDVSAPHWCRRGDLLNSEAVSDAALPRAEDDTVRPGDGPRAVRIGGAVRRRTLGLRASAPRDRHRPHHVGRGQRTIDYTVFRSHTSAVNTWYDDVTAATTAFNFQARLRVYGLAAPNVLYLGGCTHAGTFADCSSFVSTASFVTGTVKVDVSIAVLGQEAMYDQSAAMSLARAANTHLRRLS